MKKLKVINYSTCVKESNTQGSIPFIAIENGAFVNLNDDETAQLAIKNESGLIKKVDVECDSNNIFNLPTNTISNLPPSKYYAELWIKHKDDTISIFPDSDFTEFEITQNAEAIIGETIPVESVNSIKDDIIKALAGKVNINANVAIKIGEVKTGENANVTNEVVNGENVLSFTIPKGEPGKNGISPTIKINKVISLPHGENSYVKNVGNDNDIELEIGLESGANGVTGKNGISPTINISKVINLPNGTPSYVKNIGSDTNVQLEIGLESPKEPINGTNGKDGKDATITVGTTTTLPSNEPAKVTNTGTNNQAVLNFAIPQGKTGESGKSASIKVGTVTESDNITIPEITNSGDSLNAIFNFVFPKIKDIVKSPTANSASQTASNNGWKTTPLKNNDDLDNFTTSGFYFADSSMNINNICPNSYTPFGLIVINQSFNIIQIGIDYTYHKMFMRTFCGWGWGQWCIVSASLIRDTPIACPGFQFLSNTSNGTPTNWYTEYVGSLFVYHVAFKFSVVTTVKANEDIQLFNFSAKNEGNDNFLQALNVNTHEFMGVYPDNSSNWHIITKKGLNTNDVISVQGSFISNM